MSAPLHYLTELTLVWTVLLAGYVWVFRERSDWRNQRYYLRITLLAGIVIPLLPALPASVAVPQLPAGLTLNLTRAAETVNQPDVVADSGLSYPVMIWLIGSVVVASLFVYRTTEHLRPRPTSAETFGGYPVIRSASVASPYAIRNRIYLPADLDPALERSALLHEAAHLDRGHHRERAVLSLMLSILWFHPLLWLVARRLTAVHEFEADAAVLQRVSRRTYGIQLVHASLSPRAVAGLFSSPLQQRIAMIRSSLPSRPLGGHHYLLLFLLLAGLFVACSDSTELLPREEVAFTLAELQQDESALRVGEDNFLQFFYERVRYPADLRRAGLTAATNVTVRVSPTGEVLDVVTRKLGSAEEADDRNAVVIVGYNAPDVPATFSTDNRFAEEIQRVLAELPTLHPATPQGGAVPAVLNFDVVYRLE